MTTLTHILTGAALAKAALASHAIPPDASTAYLVGVLAANLPDMDTPFVSVAFRDIVRNMRSLGHVPIRKNHRTQSFFHYPLVWLIAFPIVAFPVAISGNHAFMSYLAFVALNVVVHFVMDSFGIGGAGICWLAPFKKTVFSVLPMDSTLPKDFRELAITYRTSALLKIEGVIGLSELMYLLRK